MLDFADLETARAARGVRMVVSGAVASPWSEAAKGLFRLARIPVLAMRTVPGDASHVPWTQSHNVPVVFHDDEPPRTVWSQIVALAARLAPSDVKLLPSEIRERSTTIGLIHEIAGEQGIGWNARIMMIHASLSSEGKRGFPLPIAKRLAGKYGYTPDALEPGRAQVIAALTALAEQLGDRPYFAGDKPGALDVYSATFLTPLTEITDAVCPQMHPMLRAAFGTAREELAQYVPAALFAQRTRMFEHHLAFPIPL
jgi:glutathione S-transferase